MTCFGTNTYTYETFRFWNVLQDNVEKLLSLRLLSRMITKLFLVQNNYYNLYTRNRVCLPFGIFIRSICTNQIS